MQTAETVLNIIRDRGQRGLPVERFYRQLYNRDLYLRAYSDAVQASPEGKALDSRIRSGFRKSIQQVQDFHRPLVELVRDPAERKSLLQLQQTVAVLLTDISSDVNQRLDLPQTFNNLDGD